jgi:DNA-binding LytR/AlgR family response regulator
MKKVQVLIVDDEPLAQSILESYFLKLSGFEIAGKCKNALEAFSFLSKNDIDVMMLDINMPEINGIDFLKTIKEPPNVIFTTAHAEFAVESYEHNAIDYLIKPISFERFMKGINKLLEVIQSESRSMVQEPAAAPVPDQKDNIIFVKSNGKLIKVDINELCFVEGLRDYVCFWTEKQKIVVHGTMKHFEELLSRFPAFLRVHKSYIINLNYVTEIDGNCIRIRDQSITIGNTYREEINKLFEKYRL